MFQDPTFWVLVAFVIFIGLLAKPVGRMIAGALDSRAEEIRKQIAEAEKLREEATALLAGYRKKQQNAAKEAEDIVARAREEATRATEQGFARLEAALKRREQMATDRIAQAESQAVSEVRARAVDIAIDATRAVLREKAKGRHADDLVERAIKELPEKLH